MRKLLLILLVTFALAPLHAQELHQATDLEMLLHRIHAGIVHEAISPVTIDRAAPLAAKTFNITAQATSGNNASTYAFTVSPLPFTVNQGDMVTLNISVPSGDKATGTSHGFFLETYFEEFSFFINKGQTRQVTFVANQPGTFSYICTQSTCGVGHTVMGGTFTVNAVQAPAPTITSLNPTSGTINGGTIVSITGANFVTGATVKFDTSNGIGTSFNSSTNILSTAPAHAAGPVTVTVTNPDGQSATATYTYVNPTISITSVSPNTGSTAGGTAVTISGANFQTGATVTFGGVAATNINVVNATTITASTPVGPISEQLGVDVTVTNPDGKSATQTRAFTYSVPAVTIDTISPATAITTGGQQILITGTGFTTALNGASVTIGGVTATFNVQSAVSISVVTPPHAAGNVDVVVKMGNGTQATKSNGLSYFVFTAPARRHSAKH